jgi:hypothetical protein
MATFARVLHGHTHLGLPPPSPPHPQVLDDANDIGPSGMAFFATWLRLSTQHQLAWHRNSNYQSKDIAHVQVVRLGPLSQGALHAGRTCMLLANSFGSDCTFWIFIAFVLLSSLHFASSR